MKTERAHGGMLLLVSVSALFAATGSARASIDWTDLCKPDVAALKKAVQDHPQDGFARSRCNDSVYARGTCSVVPSAGAGPEAGEALVFRVKLQTDAGVERAYDVTLAPGPGSEPAHPRGACVIRDVREGREGRRGRGR